MTHPVRGSLEAVLVSPAGTRTRLLSTRPRDTSELGFRAWPLTSVETWGEAAAGVWRLYLASRAGPGVTWSPGNSTLVLHGTH